jgi:proline racemase
MRNCKVIHTASCHAKGDDDDVIGGVAPPLVKPFGNNRALSQKMTCFAILC